MYTWNWNIIWVYKTVFIQGALVTIGLTLIAIILGTILGVIFAFIKRSANPVFSYLTRIYIELFRAIPILVLLIWVFYVLPIIFGLRLTAFNSAILALSLNLSAFVAETVRAGIESIPAGQFESAYALGMNKFQAMWHIIFPQAIKNMIPNLMGLYINEIKNSSLASVIAVGELLHQSNTLISNTYRPLEIYTTVAIMYLVIILPLVFVARIFEKRLNKSSASEIVYE